VHKEWQVWVVPSSSSVATQHRWPYPPLRRPQWQEALPASPTPGFPCFDYEVDDEEGKRQQLHAGEEEEPTSSLTVAREVVPAPSHHASLPSIRAKDGNMCKISASPRAGNPMGVDIGAIPRPRARMRARSCTQRLVAHGQKNLLSSPAYLPDPL
jgi:hypothetical protein